MTERATPAASPAQRPGLTRGEAAERLVVDRPRLLYFGAPRARQHLVVIGSPAVLERLR